jgi:predicted dehydrogenase
MAVHRRTEILLDDLVAGIKGARVETAEGWCFERQATAFVDALTDDVLPLTSGEAAFADMELIEAIWRHVEG